MGEEASDSRMYVIITMPTQVSRNGRYSRLFFRDALPGKARIELVCHACSPPCLQNGQRVGDLLVELIVGEIAAVKLVIDLAVLDKEDASGAAGRADGVRDHQDRLPAAADVGEHAQQLVRRLGVQRAGRLVGQQKARVRDDRAGDGRALFLAAGNFIRVLFSSSVMPSRAAMGSSRTESSFCGTPASTSGR